MLCKQSFAQNVEVYGRLLMTANQVETGDVNKVTEIKDNGSRLGFKGVEDLGLGMSALFGLEMGINADSGLTTTPAFAGNVPNRIALQLVSPRARLRLRLGICMN